MHCFLVYKDLAFETFYVNPLKVADELPLGHQIPVLSIDGELRNDSTPIGQWLEQRYPGRPRSLPADAAERERVLAIDRWVSDTLVPVIMRLMLAVGEPLGVRVRNRRRGARALHTTVPAGIPLPLRLAYPFVIARVGFLRRMIAATDLSRPNSAVFATALEELLLRVAGGPFLGGLDGPTLADLSAYAQLALPYMAGYDGIDAFMDKPEILDWFLRVQERLDPGRPLLPRALIERKLPAASEHARVSESHAGYPCDTGSERETGG